MNLAKQSHSEAKDLAPRLIKPTCQIARRIALLGFFGVVTGFFPAQDSALDHFNVLVAVIL